MLGVCNIADWEFSPPFLRHWFANVSHHSFHSHELHLPGRPHDYLQYRALDCEEICIHVHAFTIQGWGKCHIQAGDLLNWSWG